MCGRCCVRFEHDVRVGHVAKTALAGWRQTSQVTTYIHTPGCLLDWLARAPRSNNDYRSYLLLKRRTSLFSIPDLSASMWRLI